MFLIALGQFLLGMSAGLTMSAAEMADADLTNRTIERAQRRVDRLRVEADSRLAEIYSRHAAWMSPQTRTAFQRRLTS